MEVLLGDFEVEGEPVAVDIVNVVGTAASREGNTSCAGLIDMGELSFAQWPAEGKCCLPSPARLKFIAVIAQ